MGTKRITVHDSNQIYNGQTNPYTYNPNKKELVMEVDALCVGGEDGIFAYFFYEDRFCMAHGDDGFWTLNYACHKDWFMTFVKEAFAPLSVHVESKNWVSKSSEIIPED